VDPTLLILKTADIALVHILIMQPIQHSIYTESKKKHPDTPGAALRVTISITKPTMEASLDTITIGAKHPANQAIARRTERKIVPS
jgi:hypothetical protein